MTYAGIFAIVIGLGMAVFWALALAKKKVPEVKTEPIRISAHIIGECITSIVLVSGGIALLLDTEWAKSLYLVASGMLVYTVIVSPGYYAQQRNWAVVGMFTIILILLIISLVFVF